MLKFPDLCMHSPQASASAAASSTFLFISSSMALPFSSPFLPS
jgi:hypothetical protein